MQQKKRRRSRKKNLLKPKRKREQIGRAVCNVSIPVPLLDLL